jgi:hypothetical protein
MDCSEYEIIYGQVKAPRNGGAHSVRFFHAYCIGIFQGPTYLISYKKFLKLQKFIRYWDAIIQI